MSLSPATKKGELEPIMKKDNEESIVGKIKMIMQ